MSTPAEVRRAVVVTVSTRAAAGIYQDRSGPIIAEQLAELGLTVEGPRVVADADLAEVLPQVLATEPALIVTTGGTGLSQDDRTPEVTKPVLDRELPHLATAIASYGAAHGVPAAVLSRGVAGVAGRTLVLNLPGSTGGARDGMAVLMPILPHALDQLSGADHRPGPAVEPEQRST